MSVVQAFFRIRRDTAANWTSVNPTLELGEPGLETDTRKVKYGDGVTAWNSLAYMTVTIAWGDITGVLTDQVDLNTALGLKAPLNSPTFTGIPAAPTAAGGTNTTQIATTAFVRAEVAAIVDTAPGTLDTLNELAAALGDDPNFATTVTNALALKAPLASPTFTGTLTYDAGIGTSLRLGGAALGSDKLAVTGTTTLNGKLTIVSGSGFRFRNAATDGFDVSQLNVNSWGWSGLAASTMWFNMQNSHFILTEGRLGVQTAAGTDPTASIEIGVAGSTTVAPFKMKTAGAALLTTPQAGVFETDGTDLYWTNNAGVRKKVTIV